MRENFFTTSARLEASEKDAMRLKLEVDALRGKLEEESVRIREMYNENSSMRILYHARPLHLKSLGHPRCRCACR